MMRLMSIALFAMTVFALPPAARAEAPVILVLGDSLSAAYGIALEDGWVTRLQRRLQGLGLDYRVVNAGISGDTTAGGLARLPALLTRYRPAVLILQLGANDGLRGLRPVVMRENLAQCIRLGREAGSRVLLIGIQLPPNYGAAFNQVFQAVFQDLANSEGVPLVPTLLAGVAEDRTLMQADDLHPNAKAQPRILDTVWPKLEPLLTPVAPRAD